MRYPISNVLLIDVASKNCKYVNILLTFLAGVYNDKARQSGSVV